MNTSTNITNTHAAVIPAIAACVWCGYKDSVSRMGYLELNDCRTSTSHYLCQTCAMQARGYLHFIGRKVRQSMEATHNDD